MYQFIHIETYARSASAQKTAKSAYSYRDILGEATRETGHCPHVAQPKPPHFLLGSSDTLKQMSENIERNASNYKDKSGRKMRADAHVLLAGVVSFPRETQRSNPEIYEKWVELNVEYLKKKYGGDLRAIIAHDDEEHPHLHFYVQSNTQVNAKDLHEGYKAGKNYKKAMKDLQDDYYKNVAVFCGMTKSGPKKMRMTHSEYRRAKEQARAIAATHDAILNDASERLKDATLLNKKNIERERELRYQQEENKVKGAILSEKIVEAESEKKKYKRARKEAEAKENAYLNKLGLTDTQEKDTSIKKEHNDNYLKGLGLS